MRQKALIVITALVGLSLVFPLDEANARGGWGWGVGLFTGGLLLGTAISRPYYAPPPVYVYPAPPVYVYSPPVVYTTPPPVYVPNQAYAYPDPAASRPPPEARGAGQWVEVPGQHVNGRWVPPHRAWAPDTPLPR